MFCFVFSTVVWTWGFVYALYVLSTDQLTNLSSRTPRTSLELLILLILPPKSWDDGSVYHVPRAKMMLSTKSVWNTTAFNNASFGRFWRPETRLTLEEGKADAHGRAVCDLSCSRTSFWSEETEAWMQTKWAAGWGEPALHVLEQRPERPASVGVLICTSSCKVILHLLSGSQRGNGSWII